MEINKPDEVPTWREGELVDPERDFLSEAFWTAIIIVAVVLVTGGIIL